MNRHLTGLQPTHAFRVDVPTDDTMAELGEACGRNEADVPDPDDPDRFAAAQRPTGLKLFAMAIIAEFGILPVNEFSSQ
jgi:hypothetical protein